MHKRALALGTIMAAAIAAGAAFGALVPSQSGDSRSRARPPASSFSAHVDNVWFPLTPGTRYVYTGEKGGQPSRDVVTVTRGSTLVDGVPCVAVHDRLYLRGRLGERTTDWYSQDANGNVWYFGEDTAELNTHGRVTSTAGTWTAGVDGAQAGIYLPAHPHVGQSGRQEFFRGQAEDHFRVVELFARVVGQRQTDMLLTAEWSPLEPGVLDHKMYARGIGTVLEVTEKGGDERNVLVAVASS